MLKHLLWLIPTFLLSCSSFLLIMEGSKPFKTSLEHIVYVPNDFPNIDFDEHRFIRSGVVHSGKGRQKLTEDNLLYVRYFARKEDFGIVSYIEAYVPDQQCRKDGIIYNWLGNVESWASRFCDMDQVWGICLWPELDSISAMCLERDPNSSNKLLWKKH